MDDGIRDLLLVVLGGLLATLSPGIVDAIARRRRKAAFGQVLSTELHELRLITALILIRVHVKFRSMNQESVDLIRPILLGYKGHTDDASALDAAKKLLGQGDAAFMGIQNSLGGAAGTALWPLPSHAPYLESHLDDLALMPVEMQRALLGVLTEVALFNEQVAYVQKASDRTFETGMSPESYAANDTNLKASQLKLVTRASQLIRGINRVLDHEGNLLK